MSLRDLIPWGRSQQTAVPVYRGDHRGADANPFLALHREVNRLFDDMFRSFDAPQSFFHGMPSWNWPSIEIADSGKDMRVTAEIPGLEENDIEVLLEAGMLTLRGEKRSETQDQDRHFSERFYGRFERRIPIEYEIEEDKVEAKFKNGVLTVILPKTAREQSKAKRIAINGKN